MEPSDLPPPTGPEPDPGPPEPIAPRFAAAEADPAASGSLRDALMAQREALAAFGSRALASTDLDALLQEATVLVARGLACPLAKVLECRPDGLSMLVKAGVGWNPGVVGHAVLPADARSAPGFALVSGLPVVTDDIDRESRYAITGLIRAHGVRSMANVIIPGPGGAGEPYGVLEVDSRAAGAFGRDDVNFLQTYANLLGAAILRHRSHDLVIAAAVEKARSAQENEILLRELQHRVMNNLQVITSLISIQQRRIRSREAADALKVIASRVETLRLLHERLYTARQMDMIDLADYLASLCATLVGFHREEVAGVTLSTRLAPIMASADTAVPLGLIVNEFVTNSLKHAFPGGKGTIRVGLAPLKEESGEGGGRARLDLADDGAGLRDPGHGARGSGLHLIRMLGTQIGAAIIWNEGGGDADTGAAGPAGTSAQVVFPLKR